VWIGEPELGRGASRREGGGPGVGESEQVVRFKKYFL